MNYPRSWRVHPTAGTPHTVAPPEGRPWYSITNQDDHTAEIILYDEIGYWGYTAQDFVRDLRAVGNRDVSLRLNSPGGEVFDGMAVHNALKRHPGRVTVHVDGLAASIASVIAMAGDRIVIAENARIMVHDASGVCVGNAADMAEMLQLLDGLSDTIAGVYAERAGGTVKQWRTRMRAETWYSADQAVEAGLATEVGSHASDPASQESYDFAAMMRQSMAAAVDAHTLRSAILKGFTS